METQESFDTYDEMRRLLGDSEAAIINKNSILNQRALATKTDILELKGSIDLKLSALEHQITKSENKLLFWFISLFAAQLIAFIVNTFFKH